MLSGRRKFEEDTLGGGSSDMDAMSEINVRRVGGAADDSSVGDESYLEINQIDGSSASGSINII